MEIMKLVYGAGDVTFLILVLDIGLGLILSMTIVYVYRITFSGITYSQSFLISLIMITMVTAVLISVIGSNLARAFSLVGALSIIRYRTAIKDARDTGFIFLCVATGMIIGAGYYILSIGLVGFMSLIIIFLDKINFASDVVHRSVIKVCFQSAVDITQKQDAISKILGSAYRQISMIEHLIDKSKKQIILTFVGTALDSGPIKEKQKRREQKVAQRIEELTDVESISIVSDQLQQNI